ncbi:MAG TPA: DNA repair protein RecN [Richelia sp.]|nr:DNA repair protein RecN [Richelia sp.]
MLSVLRIENFALVDRLELSFGIGLNVLTGETGAGKSVILDAIDAVLGGKASSKLVRAGNNKAIIEATFTLSTAVAAWLIEQGIDLIDDNSVIVSREITLSIKNIRSRSRINGILVNRQIIAEMREYLVEITAQGETVQIGQSAQVREWLDAYGDKEIGQQRQTIMDAFKRHQTVSELLEKCRDSAQEKLQKLDLLAHQLQELGGANLYTSDELEQLQQEYQRLNHVEKLQQMSYKVYQALYQDESQTPTATDLLSDSEVDLTNMVDYDSQLQAILDMVCDAQATIKEAARQVNKYGESLEANPQRLKEVESRIRQLKQICRKYGPTLNEAIAYYQSIEVEIDLLNTSEQSIEDLELEERECWQKLTQACQKLTQLRISASNKLESELIGELKRLAMEKVKFHVDIVSTTPTIYGADKITFMFSPNYGEPLKPLSNIASGGEMIRFLLALKACIFEVDRVETMIFDEIDVGVSGMVAQAIAEKLYQISQGCQVLCVTHQPLVAAMADRHFQVSKKVIDKKKGTKENNEKMEERTIVKVTALDTLNKRREELAQLAGGKSAQNAITFADSLLTQAAHYRVQQN